MYRPVQDAALKQSRSPSLSPQKASASRTTATSTRPTTHTSSRSLLASQSPAIVLQTRTTMVRANTGSRSRFERQSSKRRRRRRSRTAGHNPQTQVKEIEHLPTLQNLSLPSLSGVTVPASKTASRVSSVFPEARSRSRTSNATEGSLSAPGGRGALEGVPRDRLCNGTLCTTGDTMNRPNKRLRTPALSVTAG